MRIILQSSSLFELVTYENIHFQTLQQMDENGPTSPISYVSTAIPSFSGPAREEALVAGETLVPCFGAHGPPPPFCSCARARASCCTAAPHPVLMTCVGVMEKRPDLEYMYPPYLSCQRANFVLSG